MNMPNDLISFEAFNSNGMKACYDSPMQEEVRELPGKHILSQMEFLVDHEKGTNLLKDQNQQQQQEQESKFDTLMSEEFNLDRLLQPTQESCVQKKSAVEYNKKGSISSSLASLELLSNYASRFKRLNVQNLSNLSSETYVVGPQKLSPEEIIRIAGARYVQSSTNQYDDYCMPMHPYGFGLGVLSNEESRDVELAQFLLAAAEKVGLQQFERASRLLLQCQWNSSPNSNTVQRLIFHFANALQDRIDKETGRMASKGYEKNGENGLIQLLVPSIGLICHQKVPFTQVMQFAGIQAIVEHVSLETRIHAIDLEIRFGVQWTIFMQALADRLERPIELLKITAIGITGKTKLEEVGERLASFAESLKLPFSYHTIYVTDIMEIKEELFEAEYDEAVAVYSGYALRTWISRPERLEKLMGVIRNIKPSIMIVLEVEANHNSTSFVNRFIEALFFHAAFLDCFDTCLAQDNESRMGLEAIVSEGIRSIVVDEGRERRVWNVKIDVWRRFFARYRMAEIGFSEASLYQASMVIKEFASGNYCTIDRDGKCLAVGWKGTPMQTVSAWRFP